MKGALLGTWTEGRALATVAGLLALGGLFAPIDWSGLWVPHELETADLARRIAQGSTGVAGWVLRDSGTPATQLGDGPLPLASIALGLETFGLHDWAGRLPLALWAALGLLPLYWVVARFVDGVAAAYAVIVLVTTPLYFVQARTMLGDAVVLSGLSCSLAGLAVLALDERSKSFGAYVRWGLLAMLGLSAGFGASGLGFGVACPTLAIGLGWLITRLAAPTERRWLASDGVALATLAIGGVSLALWIYLVVWRLPTDYQSELGIRLARAARLPTFDSVLHQLGFGLFPWSALLPFLLGPALMLSSSTQPAREHRLSIGAATLVTLAYALHGFSATLTHAVPFVGVAALALIVGVGLRNLELSRTHPESTSALRLLALGSSSMLVLLGVDLCKQPAQIFNAFALPTQAFPASFEAASKRWWIVGVGALLASMALAFVRGREPRREGGGDPPASSSSRHRAGGLRFASMNRIRFATLSVAAFGAALSFSYFPALASSLAPRDVFGAYERLSQPGEGLAALGAAASVADYYARGPAIRANSVASAIAWLNQVPGRAWLIFDARDLAPLNALHRERSDPPRNLAVAAIGPGNMVLAANRLPSAERDQNPLARWIRSATDSGRWPAPMHGLDVDLAGQLRCVGWSIASLDGRPAARLRAGTGYRLAITFEVLASLSTNWKAFVQMEGDNRLLDADHELLEGRYPTRFWRAGDVITDEHVLNLAPHVSDGTYQLFFGLYEWGDQRLPVLRGKHDRNRIAAGELVVGGGTESGQATRNVL